MINIVTKFIRPLPVMGAIALFHENLENIVDIATHPNNALEGSVAVIAFTCLCYVLFRITDTILHDFGEIYNYFKKKAVEEARLALEFANYKKNHELTEQRNQIEQDKLDALEKFYNNTNKA